MTEDRKDYFASGPGLKITKPDGSVIVLPRRDKKQPNEPSRSR